MNGPRTVREALVAELLGDVDRLLDRVEALAAVAANAESRMFGMVTRLEEAGDKYRLAVTAFNEQAKADLSQYYDLKTRLAAQEMSKSLQEQRSALQEAAHLAFLAEASDNGAHLVKIMASIVEEVRQSMKEKMLEYAAIAMIVSAVTVGLVHAIFK